jgi:hypothetical protein
MECPGRRASSATEEYYYCVVGLEESSVAFKDKKQCRCAGMNLTGTPPVSGVPSESYLGSCSIVRRSKLLVGQQRYQGEAKVNKYNNSMIKIITAVPYVNINTTEKRFMVLHFLEGFFRVKRFLSRAE